MSPKYDFVKPYLQADPSTNTVVWQISYALRESPLPRDIRRNLIDRIQGMPRLPLPEPLNTNVGGAPVKFKIENQVDWERLANPLYEGKFANIVMDCLREVGSAGVFWDIGAAQGLYTAPAVKIVGKVIAFEPDGEARRSLIGNIVLNDRSGKAVCLPMAVGDMDGTIRLFSEGNKGDSPSVKKVNKNNRSTQVECRKIDTLIKSGSIPAPDVMKIDIEGHEAAVLKGGERLFKSARKPRSLLIEIHPVYLSQFYGISFKEVWTLVTDTYGYIPVIVMSHHPNRFMCYLKNA